MHIRYRDLIDQTYYFPQEEFSLRDSELLFHNVDLNQLVAQYGAPLKFTYLPKISENINRAKQWFKSAMDKHNYPGNYYYSYCTKSSHFKHVLNEALKNDIHIETSSAFDINIVEELKKEEQLKMILLFFAMGLKGLNTLKTFLDSSTRDIEIVFQLSIITKSCLY